jgi:hypothetical protein
MLLGGLAITAESEAVGESSCASHSAGTSIMGRVWRRFVVPHCAWNSTWDLYGDDRADL